MKKKFTIDTLEIFEIEMNEIKREFFSKKRDWTFRIEDKRVRSH